ncbi:MAG TPA: sigma-70 family RNA polymerase sigma factor [Planctomycetota bacterium]|nr:sigma-70 family RNA polymerase sigma factor [Planctomycetota bacterium]
MTDDKVELYRRAAAGDAVSLDALLQRYLPQLHAYVHVRLNADLRARESSMDVVQSVCRDVLAHRERFDFRGEERFRAWLFTSALNKIRNKYAFHHGAGRDVAREEHGTAALDAVLAATADSPSGGAMAAEGARIVREALAALSEEHREVVTLSRIVGLPHQVIAEVMGRSEEAARQLLRRAIVQFTFALKRRGVEPD